MNRRHAVVGLLALGAAPFSALAQQSGKVWRIGFLSARARPTPENPEPFHGIFVQGLRDLGYVEGKNLVIEWRFADGKYERLPALAAELVRMNVDVAVTHLTAGVLALRRETRTIPIVTIAMGDPVGTGVAASLARPGGNVTGLSMISVDVVRKQLELLAAMVPRMSRIAVLLNPGSGRRDVVLKIVQDAAQQFGIRVLPVDVPTPEDLERGFNSMTRERVDALFIWADSYFIGLRRQVSTLALKNRIPTMFYYREDVQAGGLMSYGQNMGDYYRRAPIYVDKILKGAKPADLPFEQPTKIHFAINRKTAKAIGVNIPSELLLRADEVIE